MLEHLTLRMAMNHERKGKNNMVVQNLVYKTKGEMSYVTWIKNRIRRHENVNAIAEGSTGSGKTYLQIQTGIDTDPEFDPQRQIVFTHSQLMKLINDPWFAAKKYKVIIFEELQIAQNARAWQSKTNKLLNMLLSTYRHRGIILLVNCPFMDYIDKQSLKLFHLLMQTRGKDLKRNVCKTRLKILQWSSKKKDFYYHSIYVRYPDGKVVKTPFYNIAKPPKEVTDVYERMKMEFTNKLNAKIERELGKMEDADKDEIEPKRAELNPYSIQPLLWEEAQKGWSTQEELAARLTKIMGKPVYIPQICRNKQTMKKRGYDINEFRRENGDKHDV